MAFIVFEGLDGAGKSTLIQKLGHTLEQRGIKFIVTREPGGTTLGEELRDVVTKVCDEPPTPRAEALLYQVSRAQHVDKKIKPELDKGNWVLCDRFTASSVAFQAGGREISRADIDWLNNFSTKGTLPHVQVLLDLTVEESRKRREGRSEETGQGHDRFENEADEFHMKVRNAFLEQAKTDPDKWIVLDAGLPPNQLLETLIEELTKRKWLES